MTSTWNKDDENTANNGVVDDEVRRYVMVEVSCDKTHCEPCTYPDCQRFTRISHLVEPVVKTVEISPEEWKELTGKKKAKERGRDRK